MKWYKYLIILIIIGLIFGFYVSAQPFPGLLWYGDETSIFPVEATWHIGSSVIRIAKGWFTDLDVSGVFTLGGTVGSGGIDLNGEPLIMDADGDTQMIADTDDQIDIDIGGVANEYQFTATQLKLGNNTLTIGTGTVISDGGIIFDDDEGGITNIGISGGDFLIQTPQNIILDTTFLPGVVRPATNNSMDLGTSSVEWADIHLAGTANVSTMAITGGSITDTSGAISFGNENLSTTGTGAFQGMTLTDNLNMSNNDITNVGTITVVTLTDGTLSISGGDLTTTGEGTFAHTADLFSARLNASIDAQYYGIYSQANAGIAGYFSDETGQHITTLATGLEAGKFLYEATGVSVKLADATYAINATGDSLFTGDITATGAITAATYNGVGITTPVPNTFAISYGTTDLVVSADTNVNQNLRTTDSPTFVGLTLNTHASNNWTFGKTTYGGTDYPSMTPNTPAGHWGIIGGSLWLLDDTSSPYLWFVSPDQTKDGYIAMDVNILNNDNNLLVVSETGRFTLAASTYSDDIRMDYYAANTGTFWWMEDEDYFKFSDDIIIDSGEKLGIGTTTPDATLSVIGDIRASGTGEFDYMGVGIAPNSLYGLYLTKAITANNQKGLFVLPSVDTTGGAIASARALDFSILASAGGNDITEMSGAYGVIGAGGTFTGTITNAYSFFAGVLHAAGTITNYNGVRIDNPTVFGGTLINNYGVYIVSQSAGTNNWSIYSAGGDNVFGGNMSIGSTATPEATLQVLGDSIFGDGTNEVTISATGDFLLKGTARVTKEIELTAAELHPPAAGNPALTEEGVFSVALFDDNSDEEVYTQFHLPRDYVDESDLSVHFHWAPTSTATGDVTWGIEWKAVTDDSDETLGAGTTQIVVDTAQGTDNEMLGSGDITISGTGIVRKDIIGLRVFRDANASEGGASDTYGADAALSTIAIEYTSDRLGE